MGAIFGPGKSTELVAVFALVGGTYLLSTHAATDNSAGQPASGQLQASPSPASPSPSPAANW